MKKSGFLLLSAVLIGLLFMFSACEKEVEVDSVSLNKTSLSLEIGQIDVLVATVQPGDANVKSCTWSSSNPALVSVDNSGVVTALAVGTAIVKAITNDGGKEASCVVTVNKKIVNVTNVSLNKNSSTLQVGDTEQLVATVVPSDADNTALTWSSSNTGVATVSASGLVTAVAAGNAVIEVTTVDGNKKSTCSYTIKNKEVDKIVELKSYYRKSKIEIEDIMQSLSFELVTIEGNWIRYLQKSGGESRYYEFVFNNSNQASVCCYWLLNEDTEAKSRYITKCKQWGDEISTLGFNDFYEGYILTNIYVNNVPRDFRYENRVLYLQTFDEYKTSLVQCYENRRKVSSGMFASSEYREISSGGYDVTIIYADLSVYNQSSSIIKRQ